MSYSIFFDPLSFDYKWARGELGDFIGGGLGGITVVFIIYTVWLQIRQINSQQNESFEVGVFRIFEALKPEVEGLSVRIVSKAIKAKIVSEDDDEPFSEMLKKITVDFSAANEPSTRTWSSIVKSKVSKSCDMGPGFVQKNGRSSLRLTNRPKQ